MTFTGLTWDHPRGYDALAAAAQQVNATHPSPLIEWEKQPLEGFESAPIAYLAARYDLLVVDHPHMGEAATEDCLIPLEELYSAETLAQWESNSIGPSLTSYRWHGLSYALPLDMATQVMVHRPDRVESPPASWEQVEALAQQVPVALSLGGPHAFLSLISMAAGEGHVIDGEDMLPDAVALEMLQRLARLARLAPKGSDILNPIALLEAMAHGDDIALVPLIFGYVNYAQRGFAPHRLAFSDTIRATDGYGGVLGGTGIAFSRRSTPSQALLDHVAWLMDPQTQTTFMTTHSGQPSARAAWHSQAVNAESGYFYADTVRTAEAALLRPRFDGYIAFQTRASHILRDAIASSRPPHETLTQLRDIWRHARLAARSSLDDNRMTS